MSTFKKLFTSCCLNTDEEDNIKIDAPISIACCHSTVENEEDKQSPTGFVGENIFFTKSGRQFRIASVVEIKSAGTETEN